MDIPQDVFESALRLNLIWQIHNENKDNMKLVGDVAQAIDGDPEITMTPEALRELLNHIADTQNTIDALLHICREYFCKEADEIAVKLTDEESLAFREKVRETEPWQRMQSIVAETAEERTQRLLLEMLGIHE